VAYRVATAEALAEETPHSYDVVTCMELLEHVPDPVSTVRACARLAKPGGRVIFSTINRTPRAFLLAIVAAEHLLGWIPQGTHEYGKLIRPSELADWGRAAGLRLTDLSGMTYRLTRRRFELSDAVDVNYLACFARDAAVHG
jgi:2-polyprenyl-6-hydroxyphenyl methylase / 3-demethylubiquinone-9 3-methyltransferase